MLQLLVEATSNPEVASSALSLLCKSVLSTIWIPHQLLLHHSHLCSYQSYSKLYIQYSNETLKKTHRWNGLNLSLWPTNIVGTRSERKRDYENSISTPPQNFPRLIISISHPLTKVASISVSAFPLRVHRLLKVWPTAVAIHHNVHSSHKWLIPLSLWPSSLKPLHIFHFQPLLLRLGRTGWDRETAHWSRESVAAGGKEEDPLTSMEPPALNPHPLPFLSSSLNPLYVSAELGGGTQHRLKTGFRGLASFLPGKISHFHKIMLCLAQVVSALLSDFSQTGSFGKISRLEKIRFNLGLIFVFLDPGFPIWIWFWVIVVHNLFNVLVPQGYQRRLWWGLIGIWAGQITAEVKGELHWGGRGDQPEPRHLRHVRLRLQTRLRQEYQRLTFHQWRPS